MSATPIDVATPALREARPEVLLDAIVQLTHHIHGETTSATAARRDAAIGYMRLHEGRAEDLRAQRALVRAELLRRIEVSS